MQEKNTSTVTRENQDKEARVFVLAQTGLMTALIMTATMMIRIHMPFTQGYVHLGDTMIFLAVLLLGKKHGALAAGLGSALADLLSGYAHYVPWTFVIKLLMGFIMGLVLEYMNQRSKVIRHDKLACRWRNDLLTAPRYEQEVGRSPTGLRISGRIVEVRSTEQSAESLLTGKSYMEKHGKGERKENWLISLPEILAMVLAGLEMTVGYYLAASVMHGNWLTPLMSVPGNIMQFAVGAVLAAALVSALRKTPMRRYFALRL